MAGDSSRPFDPIAQFAELQQSFGGFFNPLKMMSPSGLLRYEAIDPQVQEIAILATMHNMASMLKDPGKIKAVITAELAERSRKLGDK